MKIEELMSLRERVRALHGPCYPLHDEIALALCFDHRFMQLAGAPVGAGCEMYRYRDGDQWESALRVTASVDAVTGLIERVLPGWWWKCGSCCVSDDACIAPDFNDPVHGERLKAQFFPLTAGSEFDAGFDVDRRPPGNVPLALLEALLDALIAQAVRMPLQELRPGA